MKYTLERRRSGSTWDSRIRVNPEFWTDLDREARKPQLEQRVAGIARMGGGPSVAENLNGELIETVQPDLSAASRRPRKPVPPQLASFANAQPPGRQTRGPNKGKGNGWIESYITDRAHGRMNRSRIQARLGPPKSLAGSVERYEETVGAETHRTLVDTVTGLIQRMEVDRGGKRVRQTTFEYAETPGGTIIRKRIHSEVAATDRKPAGIVDIEFSNTQLEKRAP